MRSSPIPTASLTDRVALTGARARAYRGNRTVGLARIVPLLATVTMIATAPLTTSPPDSEAPSLVSVVLAPFCDAWIAGRARLALLATAGIRVGAVAVEAFRGNVVLSGDVASEATREEAERIVRSLTSVTGVSNHIRVRGAQAFRPRRADAEIRVAVTIRLRRTPALRASTIHVASVYDGVVRLAGMAPSATAADAAYEFAIVVPGVRRVVSDVAVTIHHVDIGADADAA